jgi:hypothetical protein
MRGLRNVEVICPSCQCAAGIFACGVGQITGSFPRVSHSQEGRIAIVTDVERGMQWTPVPSTDE